MSGVKISTASPPRDAVIQVGVTGEASQRARVGASSAAAVFLGAGLTLVRQTGMRSWSTPWAEDGAVFLTQAWALGPEAVAQPYTGYVHLVPRLLAELTVLLPVTLMDQFLALSSALLVAALGVFVFFATAEFLPQRVGRAVLGAAFVLAPTLAQETAANLTNLHWYLFSAALFALLWRPPTRAAAAVATVLAAATALSSPMGLLLAPVALVCAALPRRPPRARVAGAVYGVAVGAQALVILATYEPVPSDPAVLSKVAETFALRVVGPLLLGNPGTVVVWRWLGQPAFALLTVLIAVLLLAGFVAAGRDARGRATRWFPVLCVAVGVASFAGPVLLRGDNAVEALQWDVLVQTGGARYTAASSLLLLAALVWAVEALRRGLPAPLGSAAAVAGVVLVVGVAATSFLARSDRSQGPLWDEGVATRGAACAEPGTTEVRVPVAPNLADGEWAATVPCAVLRR